MTKVLRILPIVVLGFAPALAQAPGEIGGREGAIEVKVDGRLCDLPRDVEIRGLVRREGRVLRRRRLDRERLWRGPGGRLEQRGDQLAVRHALVELVERVAPWRHIRQPHQFSTLLSGQKPRRERRPQEWMDGWAAGKKGSCLLVLTYEGCIVLDAVVHVEVREIEAPGVVGAVEDPRDVARDVEAERGSKVVRRADLGGQLAEGNVASVAGDETCEGGISERTEEGKVGKRGRQWRGGEIKRDETRYEPWFAIALRAGHEQRLSASLGGMYSGQTPPSPGWPLGVTWPTLRLKVKRLTTQRERSQSIRPVKKAPW